MSSLWFVVTAPGELGALASMTDNDLKTVSVLAIGSKAVAAEAACGTRMVRWIPAEGALEDYASAAADTLLDAESLVIFGFATPAVRALAGLVAVEKDVPVLSDVTALAVTNGEVSAEHTIVDGKVVESVASPAPVCLLASTVTFQAQEPDEGAPKAAIETVDAAPGGAVKVIETNPVPEAGVETADYVVGVGRGIADRAVFDEAAHLAEILGAELSGTMPGVRDFGYFPPDASYIGLSGSPLNAKLYIALGIFGASAHLTGLLGAQRVVCVNKDASAALFDHADYGIVAPAEEVLPELIRALG